MPAAPNAPFARMAAVFALLLLLLPAPGRAEMLPGYESLFVNDYADVIAPADERRLVETLRRLKAETGIEMTVLTIKSRKGYDHQGSLESFATGIFNEWGIGDASRNDGILILVIPDDREMRIELGSGYPRAFDRTARHVVDEFFLPSFRSGRLSQGIVEGTLATERLIARPFAAGRPPAETGGGKLGSFLLQVIVFGAAAALLKGRRRIGDFLTRLRRCPRCGQRALRRNRRILRAPTRETTGEREIEITCRNCGYETREREVIEVTRSRGSSGFGGGRSSGGGASGRW